MLIYVIRNLINGKLYVGKTERTLAQRQGIDHLAVARNARLPLTKDVITGKYVSRRKEVNHHAVA